MSSTKGSGVQQDRAQPWAVLLLPCGVALPCLDKEAAAVAVT